MFDSLASANDASVAAVADASSTLTSIHDGTIRVKKNPVLGTSSPCKRHAVFDYLSQAMTKYYFLFHAFYKMMMAMMKTVTVTTFLHKNC